MIKVGDGSSGKNDYNFLYDIHKQRKHINIFTN